MAQFRLTAEQQAISAAFADTLRDRAQGQNRNLVIEALAGSGKTSTLVHLAEETDPALIRRLADALPGRNKNKMLYVAYNKVTQLEAEARFPAHVEARTSHSLAYGAVGFKFRPRLDKKGAVSSHQKAQILGIHHGFMLAADVEYTAAQLGIIAVQMVDKYSYSADEEIDLHHLPYLPGVGTPELREALAKHVLPYARRAWADILKPEGGRLKFVPDYYMKIWQLSKPILRYPVIFLDEAQDTNAALADIIKRQTHALIVMVGDRFQAIYGWRGAIDAMEGFDGERYVLSQSFRFGPEVARIANMCLRIPALGGRAQIRGFDAIDSQITCDMPLPDAVLCRSNAGAIKAVVEQHKAGRRVALVGGGKDIRLLAEAARDLQNGRGTSHPELFVFPSWKAVQQYVVEEGAADLKVLVKIIDEHGAEEVIRIVDQLVDERYADVTVTTVHKAKGREWRRVHIATDFPEPRAFGTQKPRIDKESAMLYYVAVTRAQRALFPEGLEHIAEFVTGDPIYPDRADEGEVVATVSA